MISTLTWFTSDRNVTFLSEMMTANAQLVGWDIGGKLGFNPDISHAVLEFLISIGDVKP